MSKLSEQDIEKRLLRFPDWEYYDDAIHAEFEFENFKDCFSAMSRIAFECEALNHHPNWSNVYNVLTISLSTHDASGVTDKDFKLAEAIETIVDHADSKKYSVGSNRLQYLLICNTNDTGLNDFFR